MNMIMRMSDCLTEEGQSEELNEYWSLPLCLDSARAGDKPSPGALKGTLERHP